MADILAKIESYKREEIAAAKRARSFAAIEAEAKSVAPPRGFLRAIERELARLDPHGDTLRGVFGRRRRRPREERERHEAEGCDPGSRHS